MDIFEDIPIFTGEDLEPEIYFPTFYIHGVNEYLSLWTTDVEDYMYKINSDIRLSDEFNGPIIQQDVVQRLKKIARHKLIVDYKATSRIILKMHPNDTKFMVSELLWRMMKCLREYKQRILIISLLCTKKVGTL